jgi:CRP-like cAMP-binding protein
MEPLFQFMARYLDLNENEKRIIQSTNVVRSFRKNDVVSGPLDEQTQNYFVLSGCVCAYTRFGDRETVSEFFFEGEPVILAPLSQAPHSAHALRCLEDSTLAISSASEGERLLREFPRFESVCRRFAEDRLAQSLHFCNQLKLLSPSEKYQFILKTRPALIERVPQHFLASYIGIAAETLSRLKKQSTNS